MSDLNQDMVNRHIANDPMCSCGIYPETAKHYLLHCLRYQPIRIRTISTLPPTHQKIATLLCGNPGLSQTANFNIAQTVHQFITESQRFVI